MRFVVLFRKKHVQLHSDFHDELPEIGSRPQRELIRDSLRHQREIQFCRADNAGVIRSETIALSAYLRSDRLT